MNADAYFEIGAAHTVCEDYAIAGSYEDLTYAILCDGCSSSQDTDVGARILAQVSQGVLKYLHNRKLLYNIEFLTEKFKEVFNELVLNKCMEVRQTLRLPQSAFDATLLVSFGVGKNIRVITMRGDGFALIKYTRRVASKAL